MLSDPNSQARFFYLAVLGLLVAAGLVRMYRGRLGQAAQHALIWALIVVGLVIAYGFRDQLLMQLLPGQSVVMEGDSVVLTRRADGHFHITADVDGEQVEFLVDTGATHIVLNRNDAERIGLEPDALNYSQRAMTANGVVLGAPVVLSRVSFAGIEDINVRATVNKGDLEVSLLGMRYLSRFQRIAIEGDRMTLTR